MLITLKITITRDNDGMDVVYRHTYERELPDDIQHYEAINIANAILDHVDDEVKHVREMRD